MCTATLVRLLLFAIVGHAIVFNRLACDRLSLVVFAPPCIRETVVLRSFAGPRLRVGNYLQPCCCFGMRCVYRLDCDVFIALWIFAIVFNRYGFCV